MRDQEIVGLWESYLQVCENHQLDEVSDAKVDAVSKARKKNVNKAFDRLDDSRGSSQNLATAISKQQKNQRLSDKRDKRNEEVEPDLFDTILDHLVAEGYADTNEAALAIMSNMSEEWREDIMEISRKTATSAYAKSATGEFEGADSDRDIKRTNNLGKHIERKFGKKAAEDADRHADSETFGRKDPRTGKRQPKPQSRFQNPNKYRTRADGKMHGQDQNKLKAKLERRRGED
jgi:hypothetical protein